MTHHFKVHPISAAAVADARVRLSAGDSAVARVIVATPLSSPCRRCLRDGAVGEAMLLFPYASIDGGGPYAESGPVFAHDAPCAPDNIIDDELPAMTADRELAVVRAYDRRDWIHSARLTPGKDAASAIAALFADVDVAYAHVRSASNGCFTYRVERVER